jgi:asparagine synthase (glutamine-hydrolysing)
MVSGGLDSAIIQAAADRLGLDPRRYCVTFPEIDNITQASLAADGRAVKAITFSKEDLLEVLPEVAYHLDTPATWTAVCLWYLCREIAADGHRVLISGEGADELFGGYARYRVLYWLDRMLKDPHLVPAYVPTILKTVGDPLTPAIRLLDRGGTAETAWRATELFERFRDLKRTLPMQFARVEYHTTMQVLLRMADRMAAAWSLENRCPFLDYRIQEFSTKVPDHLLVNEHENKSILRALARRWRVHPAITDERTKRGLAIPWNTWCPGTGEWDRKSFAALMLNAWRQSLSRHVSCNRLTAPPQKCTLAAVAGGDENGHGIAPAAAEQDLLPAGPPR